MKYQCKAVILCLGINKKKKIAGLEKYEKENVSYCAICDGFFYKGKTIAVIGEGDFAVNECKELENLANKIYLLTNGDSNINYKNTKVEIIKNKINTFEGKTRLEKITFEGNKSINVDGVFIANGNLSTLELSKQLGLITKNNFVVIDNQFMTNVAGVFAGGDMIGGLLQVSKAVSDGAQAGLEAVRYIKFMELKNSK